MAALLELDEAIQTVEATLARRMCTFIHQGLRHCSLTANGWEKADISACTISVKVGSTAIPYWSMPVG